MSRSIENFSGAAAPRSASRGEDLAMRLQRMCEALRRLPHRLARALACIKGIKSSGKFLEGQENMLLKIGEVLRDSRTVYHYGTDMLYVIDTEAETIMGVEGTKKSAPGILANIMVFQEQTATKGTIEFLAPLSVLEAVFRNRTVLGMLPNISYLAKTPVFGPEFTLLQGPGYHDCGIMVLARPVEPVAFALSRESEAINRLPRLLRRLLRRFCFRSNADVANTLAVLLTAILMNHCIGFARALIIVDGNRPGIGKTLLIQVLGLIVDGEIVPAIPYIANDEELQKRIIARIQRSRCRLLFLDNAKTTVGGAVSSPVLESLSSDSVISGRLLGTSCEVAIKNDLLFAMTMNCTNISPDLLSRSLPIQLRYEEGDPRHRDFEREDPLQFARENRDGILAELLGMVDYWNAQGQPRVESSHRCHQWASLIGSVLHSCGFPEFLTNFDTAAEEFNSQTEELRELFDAVCGAHSADLAAGTASPGISVEIPSTPLPPAQWGDFLKNIQSHADAFGHAKTKNSAGMKARNILGTYLNCEFEFEGENGSGTAVLRSQPLRGRQTGYRFEATFNAPEPGEVIDIGPDTEEIPM